MRHEFTMFLNVNDLPMAWPAIGVSMLMITYTNKYVKDPKKPSHKFADQGTKQQVHDCTFADGVMHLVLHIYQKIKQSGKLWSPFPRL
jgi:hypothetical protein